MFLRRWSLRLLRNLIWRADEWVHAQERKLQVLATSHSPLATASEYDPAASAARERATVRARRPRLKYVGGQFVRTLPLVLLILLTSTAAFSQQDDKVLVPRDLLTKDQLAKVSGSNVREDVHQWVGIGKEVGEAVNASLSAITTQTNNFAQTGVGKLTVILVVWRVMGDQVIHVAFGLLELIVFTSIWIWSYRKTCLTRRVETEKGKYAVVEYKSQADFTPRIAHLFAAAVIIVVIAVTVFSY